MTFMAGGWVLLLSLVLCAALITWACWGLVTGEHPLGDGRDPSTYGFDLSNCLVDRESIQASGQRRDFVAPLVRPHILAAKDVESFNAHLRQEQHLKFVVPDDRVIGVVVNGMPRAYPIRILNNHEIVNDVLGGVPIAVTFSPLCDAPVVFDRRVDGRTLEFAISGLLHNGNLLLYDRETDHQPSLWTQLDGRAVCGPAADRRQALSIFPYAAMTTWEDWLGRYPATTIADGDPSRRKQYKEVSYRRYLDAPGLVAPVVPPPTEAHGLSSKTRVLALLGRETARVYRIDELLTRCGEHGWTDTFELTSVRFVKVAIGPAAERGEVVLEFNSQPDPPVRVLQCLWFAWERAFQLPDHLNVEFDSSRK